MDAPLIRGRPFEALRSPLLDSDLTRSHWQALEEGYEGKSLFFKVIPFVRREHLLTEQMFDETYIFFFPLLLMEKFIVSKMGKELYRFQLF